MAKIAIIDDSQASIDMMTNILQGQGHTVSAFISGATAEDTLAAIQPDMLLLDVVMPERNGYEVLRGLKRNAATKTIPVILVSSKGEETDIRWGKRLGALDYIVKPYTPDQVIEKLTQHL